MLNYDLGAFIQYIRVERRYSERTVLGYERDVRAFLSVVCVGEEPFDPALISADDLRGWIIGLRESSKLQASSINKMICSVRAWFRFLRKSGVIVKDPFLKIGFLKTPSKLPVYITESQMHAVVADIERQRDGNGFISKRNALIILLFYSTGIRLAELIGIDRLDFSADMRELRVRGKGDKERIVPIIDHVKVKIIDYLDTISGENICSSSENSLFLTEKGERISRTEVYNIVRSELAKAGVQGKRSPHVLRHTFATHLLDAGADMREIQELLGHNSLSATQIYTHNTIAKLKQVYKDAHPRAYKNK